MTAYLIVWGVILVVAMASVARRSDTLIWAAAVPVLVLFAGLRKEVGWDHEVYDQMFAALRDGSIAGGLSEFSIIGGGPSEPGFVLLAGMIGATGIPEYLVIVALIVVLSFVAYRRTFAIGLPLFAVLYVYYGYYHTFSILRQALAMAIVAVAIPMKQRWHYGLAVIAAGAIHLGAIPLALLLGLLELLSGVRILAISVTAAWAFSLLSITKSAVTALAGAVGYERWLALLDVSEMTYKVGVSWVLVEQTLVAVGTYLVRSNSRVWRLAAAIVSARLLLYGCANDVSIVWERLNAGLDALYAGATAWVCVQVIAKNAENKQAITQMRYVCIVVMAAAYVFMRYERLINSEARVQGELSHYERFIPYRSIIEF